MISVPEFYVKKAFDAFKGAWGDDPNVKSVRRNGSQLEVELLDLDDGIFPSVIDGVRIEYYTS